jgi:hypothetical protein
MVSSNRNQFPNRTLSIMAKPDLPLDGLPGSTSVRFSTLFIKMPERANQFSCKEIQIPPGRGDQHPLNGLILIHAGKHCQAKVINYVPALPPLFPVLRWIAVQPSTAFLKSSHD